MPGDILGLFIPFYRVVRIHMPPWRESVVKIWSNRHHGWLRIFSLLFLQNIRQNVMLNVPMTLVMWIITSLSKQFKDCDTCSQVGIYYRVDHCWHVLAALLSLQLSFGLRLMKFLDDVSHINRPCVQICHWRTLMMFLYCSCYRWSLPCQILFGTSYLTLFWYL